MPAATEVAVVLRYDSPRVELEVTDDGRVRPLTGSGEQPGLGGHGIEGMRERAGLHQGTLSAGPREAGGWVVSASVRPTRRRES
jgi:signal transduction histidine kinase